MYFKTKPFFFQPIGSQIESGLTVNIDSPSLSGFLILNPRVIKCQNTFFILWLRRFVLEICPLQTDPHKSFLD